MQKIFLSRCKIFFTAQSSSRRAVVLSVSSSSLSSSLPSSTEKKNKHPHTHTRSCTYRARFRAVWPLPQHRRCRAAQGTVQRQHCRSAAAQWQEAEEGQSGGAAYCVCVYVMCDVCVLCVLDVWVWGWECLCLSVGSVGFFGCVTDAGEKKKWTTFRSRFGVF